MPIVEASGKLNKSALPKVNLDETNGVLIENWKTQTEKTVAIIFCRTLKVHVFDVQDNFFENGGWVRQSSNYTININNET